MHFFISSPRGTAWFSLSRQPDIHRFLQVVGEHRNIVCHWWFPVSFCFSSTREDISSFPGTAHCFFHTDRKGVGQGWGTKAPDSSRKLHFTVPGRENYSRPLEPQNAMLWWQQVGMGQRSGISAAVGWGAEMLWRATRGVEGTLMFSSQ